MGQGELASVHVMVGAQCRMRGNYCSGLDNSCGLHSTVSSEKESLGMVLSIIKLGLTKFQVGMA